MTARIGQTKSRTGGQNLIGEHNLACHWTGKRSERPSCAQRVSAVQGDNKATDEKQILTLKTKKYISFTGLPRPRALILVPVGWEIKNGICRNILPVQHSFTYIAEFPLLVISAHPPTCLALIVSQTPRPCIWSSFNIAHELAKLDSGSSYTFRSLPYWTGRSLVSIQNTPLYIFSLMKRNEVHHVIELLYFELVMHMKLVISAPRHRHICLLPL